MIGEKPEAEVTISEMEKVVKYANGQQRPQQSGVKALKLKSWKK